MKLIEATIYNQSPFIKQNNLKEVGVSSNLLLMQLHTAARAQGEKDRHAFSARVSTFAK